MARDTIGIRFRLVTMPSLAARVVRHEPQARCNAGVSPYGTRASFGRTDTVNGGAREVKRQIEEATTSGEVLVELPTGRIH
jgi:hypothetical protein